MGCCIDAHSVEQEKYPGDPKQEQYPGDSCSTFLMRPTSTGMFYVKYHLSQSKDENKIWKSGKKNPTAAILSFGVMLVDLPLRAPGAWHGKRACY